MVVYIVVHFVVLLGILVYFMINSKASWMYYFLEGFGLVQLNSYLDGNSNTNFYEIIRLIIMVFQIGYHIYEPISNQSKDFIFQLQIIFQNSIFLFTLFFSIISVIYVLTFYRPKKLKKV